MQYSGRPLDKGATDGELRNWWTLDSSKRVGQARKTKMAMLDKTIVHKLMGRSWGLNQDDSQHGKIP